MRRGRIFIYLALILLLGLVAAAVFYVRVVLPGAAPAVAEVTPTPVVDLVDVVVAIQRIPRGSVMDESVLGTVQIDRSLLIQGYFTDLSQVLGRRAKVDLEANMLITSGMVVDSAEQLSSTGSLAALTIPRGMVAVSIPINTLSSVSYALRPGDHVNVIATMLLVDLDTEFQTSLPNQSAAVLGAGPGVVIGVGTEEESTTTINMDLTKMTAQNVAGGVASMIGRAEIDPILEQTYYVVPSERQRPRLVSQTLLQDAIVLGIGTFSLEEPEEPAAAAPSEEAEATAGEQPEATPQAAEEPQEQSQPQAPEIPEYITLIVTPQDAVTLNYLVNARAQLTLALRSAGDDSRVQTEATTLDFLLKQYNIPVPVSLPYGLEPRVDEFDLPEPANGAVPTETP